VNQFIPAVSHPFRGQELLGPQINEDACMIDLKSRTSWSILIPRRQAHDREYGDACILEPFSVLPRNLAFLEDKEEILLPPIHITLYKYAYLYH
jgi:hypothetical protein